MGLVAVHRYQGLGVFLSLHSATLRVSFILGLASLAVIGWMSAATGPTYFLIICLEEVHL